MINGELRRYIEFAIFPQYKENDEAHNIDHINYVIERSLKFAKSLENINLNMVFTIAAYHDIGISVDRDRHEVISAEMLKSDIKLREFFTLEEIEIMSEAVADHRGSLEYEPRSIYGKIVSSADRNTDVGVALKRTHKYGLKHFSNMTNDELAERARVELDKRFGDSGYSVDKMYFDDVQYQTYLNELRSLLTNKKAFAERYFLENDIKK